MIALDGAAGEGGGQVLRTALAMSCLTGKAFELSDIRANRPTPGLRPQHLASCRVMQNLCSAEAEGLEIGSSFIRFTPGMLRKKIENIDIGTAGSITLLLQSILLPLAAGTTKKKVVIVGGTDVKWSMPIDYFKQVVLPQYRRIAEIQLNVLSRGYYPRGGGSIELIVAPRMMPSSHRPVLPEFREIGEENAWEMGGNTEERVGKQPRASLPSIDLVEQGKLVKIDAVINAHNSYEGQNLLEKIEMGARGTLSKINAPLHIRKEYNNALDKGFGVTLWASFSKEGEEIDYSNPVILGSDCLGENPLSAIELGQSAAEKLREEIESKCTVDEHLADNLIPMLGLLAGRIKASRISSHAKTNMEVVEAFLGKKFKVDYANNIIEMPSD